MKRAPYPAYRPSGIEWLGDVPQNWAVKRLGHYFLERREKVSDKDYSALSVTKQGVVPQLETAAKTDDGDNRKLVRAGDFVINGRSDRKGSSGLAQTDGSVSLINIVLQPRGLDGRFAHQLLRSYPFQEEFYRYGKGIVADLWSTNYSDMRNISLAVPSVPEQTTIGSFLDRETTKLDTLITKQESLIELLQEKRQAVISFAIRIRPIERANVKLSYLIDLLPGFAFPSEGFSNRDDDIRLLRGINVGVGSLRWDETVYWPKSEVRSLNDYLLRDGDLVFGMDRPWIANGVRVATVTKQDMPCLLLQRVCRLRARHGLEQEFLRLILSSNEFKEYVETDLTGISVPHISPDQICSYRIALPSQQQQQEACRWASSETARIDLLVEKALRAIDLMREHRAALIAAAVTGKIDVREAA